MTSLRDSIFISDKIVRRNCLRTLAIIVSIVLLPNLLDKFTLRNLSLILAIGIFFLLLVYLELLIVEKFRKRSDGKYLLQLEKLVVDPATVLVSRIGRIKPVS